MVVVSFMFVYINQSVNGPQISNLFTDDALHRLGAQ